MNRRTIFLISFFFTSLIPLFAQVNYDLFATVSQGFRTFGADEYDPYRAPMGIGIGFRTGNFWKSLNLGIDLTWSGFSPEENELSFEDSGMFTGLFSVGWMFSLLDDPTTSFTLGPIAGAGIYSRSISWDSGGVNQTRSLLMAGVECMLKTDNSMIFGTSLKLRGFMDNTPVWGLALDIHVGYRFGGRV